MEEPKIDFNKLVRDIIKAAKEELALGLNGADGPGKNTRLTTTLKLEVRVIKHSLDDGGDAPINSTKVVLFSIND